MSERPSDATRSIPAESATLPHDPNATLAAEPPSPAAPPDLPPNYTLAGEIGRGAMGVVYRVRQVLLNREVALKLILSGRHASPTELARFLAEVQAAAAVDHPNVVRVYESGEHRGTPYLAMELVSGGTLATKLDGRPLLPSEAAELVAHVAAGVQAAHAAGIVHRDLKPGNILLAADGTPKVADFGLAKRPGGTDLTHTGAILGTPGYMAPEQARGQGKAVGPPADVYALGAVLFTCLAGRPPFVGTDPLEVVMKAATEDPPSLRGLVKGIPRDLDTVVAKCLRNDPAGRYATAGDLADDLRRWLEGQPIHARRAGWMERGWRKMGRYRFLPLAIPVGVVMGAGVWAIDRLTRPPAAGSQGVRVAPIRVPDDPIRVAERLNEARKEADQFLARLSVRLGENPDNITDRFRQCWDERRSVWRPTEPWYEVQEPFIHRVTTVGEDEVVFEGIAMVSALFGWPAGKLPTGGEAKFVLTMRREGERWLADDLEFRERWWEVGPAKLSDHLDHNEVCDTLGIERLPFDLVSLPALKKNLGVQSWVLYHSGGPVRYRLTAEEEGQGKPCELLAVTFDVPEGRVCVLTQRVPDAKTGEPTDTVRVRLNRDTTADFNLPFLWYHWKGAEIQASLCNAAVANGEEPQVLEVVAEEVQPPEGKPPRKVVLRLYAKKAEKR